MRLLVLLAALWGCSSDATEGVDAPPEPSGDIAGTYSVTVVTLNIPQDPCICGDWCEADEYEILTVTKNGDLYTADFASYPAFLYSYTVTGVMEGEELTLPALEWPENGHRTSELRLRFEGVSVAGDFVFFNDALGATFEKQISGIELR